MSGEREGIACPHCGVSDAACAEQINAGRGGCCVPCSAASGDTHNPDWRQAVPQADGLSEAARDTLRYDIASGYHDHTAHDRVCATVESLLAARDRDHEAEVQRRLAEQREGIAAVITERSREYGERHQAVGRWAASFARTYGAES